MCTLIVGIDLLGAGTLILGANRDESPERPTAGPGVLRERPRVVGGRDLKSGGTWLAIREGRVVTALMNRRPARRAGPDAAPPVFRSRGLLCLDVAASGPPVDAPFAIDPGTGERHPARLRAALERIARDAYDVCTLVGLAVGEESWWIRVGEARAPESGTLQAGWHVITHADFDDREEPRTAWLLDGLRGWKPGSAAESLNRIGALLREHGDPDRGVPAVCLHRDHFPTVSSSLLALGALDSPRYLHSGGPPCSNPYVDVSELLR